MASIQLRGNWSGRNVIHFTLRAAKLGRLAPSVLGHAFAHADAGNNGIRAGSPRGRLPRFGAAHVQPDARAAVGPLAALLAGHGATVVAPDWNSRAPDGGRGELLRSVEFARSCAGGDHRIVLVGWSLGGAAAAGLTLAAARLDVLLAHTVCLAGAVMVADPISGHRATDQLSADRAGTPFTLLHGVHDDVVPLAASREFAARLREVGWPVELHELGADHGTIAGAAYDRVAERFGPATDESALRVAEEVAGKIAATSARPPPGAS